MDTKTDAIINQKSKKQSNSYQKSGFFGSFYTDVAIDLGTANTLIYQRNKGVVLNETSIVAINPQGKLVATGQKAMLMHEKTHRNIRTVRPLKDGVIADFEIAEMMIQEMIKNVKHKWYSPIRQMFICVPNGITTVERMAVRESAENTGAKEVYLVEETVAAAIGMGLNVTEPVGNMIIDFGGGTTEIAILSLSGIVYSQSVRLGGDKLNQDISNYFRRNYNFLIGERTAEKIKCEVGSAILLNEDLEMIAKGRDLVSGVPKTLRVTSKDVHEAIYESINTFMDAITKSLEQTPPELASDILDRGIMLSGGGALLKNIDKLITESTNLPVNVADDPLTTVVRGTGIILENYDTYKSVIA